MHGNLRGLFLGACFGVFAGTLFVVSGCGSGSSTLPWRQVDRAGKPGLEMMFLADPKTINAFNFLSPAGDRFALDVGDTTGVASEYTKVLRALAALTCFVADTLGETNLKPFGNACPAIDLSTGAAPAAFATWMAADNGVIDDFVATFLPDVLRIDTDVVFANRDVLRYAFLAPTFAPYICNPTDAEVGVLYCGGRRFGEDAIRFNYSQTFLGTNGTAVAGLATVQDDGLGPTAIDATFPYMQAPGP